MNGEISRTRLLLTLVLNLLSRTVTTLVLPVSDSSLTLNNSRHGFLANEVPICIHSGNWMGHDIHVDDCHTVIEEMYQYYRSYFFYFYKFATPDVMPLGPEHIVRTPIKMHHGRSDPPSQVNIVPNEHVR